MKKTFNMPSHIMDRFRFYKTQENLDDQTALIRLVSQALNDYFKLRDQVKDS